MNKFIPTKRTKVNRLAKRGFYDKETIYGILDEGIICHIGFTEDYELNVWAGALPVQTIFGEFQRDKQLKKNIVEPDYILDFVSSKK